MRLRYVEHIQVDPDNLTVTHVLYRANGMFDPKVAIGGHQPLGFDEWMSRYYHFTVLGSRIRVAVINNTNTQATVPCYHVVALAGGTNDFASMTPETIFENRMTSRVNIGGLVTSAYGRDPVSTSTSSTFFSAKKFFGRRNIVGDALYRGNSAADPTEQALYDCMFFNINGNNPGLVNVRVTIDYFAVFTEPIPFQTGS